MQEQNYANHTKLVTPFHKVLIPLAFATLIGSFVNLYHSIGDHERLYNAALIVALSLGLFVTIFFCRVFALQAQDRAIRAEERFRYYVLTGGKLLDSRLKRGQIVALRFASDAEFVDLSRMAADKGMSGKEIKMAIKNWKADHERL